MPKETSTISRRDFFASLVPGRRRSIAERTFLRPAPSAPAAPPAGTHTLAVIAGRFCLAYQGSFCSTCRERCPVGGAITVERGLPRVDPALCNGCRICHDVCPAPTNAIRLIPRA